MCPSCGSKLTNRMSDYGCMTFIMIACGWILLYIPTVIYLYNRYFHGRNTRCLGCGHEWNAPENRRLL